MFRNNLFSSSSGAYLFKLHQLYMFGTNKKHKLNAYRWLRKPKARREQVCVAVDKLVAHSSCLHKFNILKSVQYSIKMKSVPVQKQLNYIFI